MQSELYSELQAAKANLDLKKLGLSSWSMEHVQGLQSIIGTKADGWFGPKSIQAFKKWWRVRWVRETHDDVASGTAILNGVYLSVPKGLKFVNHKEDNGIPADPNNFVPRKHTVTQLIFHRGAESHRKDESYAQATERVLDARGLSTSFTMDVDGTIYQHFDPAQWRGRHCTHHNVQSDSLDIAGPFDMKRTPALGQRPLSLMMAIGRKGDNLPPLRRQYNRVDCWQMTPAQEEALILFVPWWCRLRGIPLTGCSDWRTFRIGGAGRRDPVTQVKGLLGHTQVSGPGARVDGILPLMVLSERMSEGIRWRSGADFFDT